MDKTLIFFTSLFALISTIILISDGFTYFHLEKTMDQLQILQKQKEKSLLNATEKQSLLEAPKLLDSNSALFNLANLCKNSKLAVEKMQSLKTHSKTPDEFEIVLITQGSYKNLMQFIELLHRLPWDIHWKTLKISQQNDQDDQLDIKMKFAISVYYFINSSPQKPNLVNQNHQTIPLSPFTISRHVGKINNTELIMLGRKIFCTS